jgi:hypothetical protein
MTIEMIFALFVVSVVLCGVAGSLVKRWEVQVPRLALVVFHLIYFTGLVAAFIFM